MLDRKQLFPFILLLLTPPTVIGEAAQCPANSATLRYHALEGSQIAISISINHSGPFDFMVDTGSEITVMDPKLAAELKLQPQGSISMAFVTNYAQAELVKPELVEAGPVAVRDLVVAVQGLNQVQALNPKLRGILGENFLGRFDLLIDYGRKLICLDQSKEMQKEMQGEKVPVIEQTEQEGDLGYTLPVLVTVHVPGDGKKGTILRIDSGSSAPILFENRLEPLSWQQRSRARQSAVAGNGGAPMFAAMTSQDVRIGSHMTRQIAFLTPIIVGRGMAKGAEDGLLPTTLFNRVFISCVDHFVMFEPR